MPRERAVRHGLGTGRGRTALRGSPVEHLQAAVARRHPRFPILGRCLPAQPLRGDLCHYTAALLQLHSDNELTASPSLSSTVPQLGLCSQWNLGLEARMLCPHPTAAPLGCWLRHCFGLKHPHSAAVTAHLSEPPPALGPLWAAQAVVSPRVHPEPLAVPDAAMAWQEMSAGHAGLSI